VTFASTGTTWSPGLEAIVRALAAECAAVGRAEGAVIPQEVVQAIVDNARNAKPTGGRNSLEADRLAGRPMEIDARNGAVVRFGRKHGVPTPMNELFVTLLTASASPWVGG
jgi:2-dehydropantoate 2-reductase